MNFQKILFLLVSLLAGVWGCKNNSTTSPNANHPIDFVVGQFGSGFDDLNAPIGLCVDAADNIYVADFGNDRIKQYNSNGICLMTWSSGAVSATNVQDAIHEPWGMAIDSGGNIYEVDHSASQIQEFSTAGGLLNQWGSAGTANGSFTNPLWIAVSPGGGIYVSESDANFSKVQLFTSPGVFGGLLGTEGGNALGDYKTPVGLAFDAAGNAYVGDLGNRRIDVYDSTGPPGAPVTTWGAGQFSSIGAMAFDHSGNLLAVDNGGGARAILKFNSNGNLIEKWIPDTVATPMDVAVDSTGAVWVTFQATNVAFLTKFAH